MKYDIHTMVIQIGEGRLYSEINYWSGPIKKLLQSKAVEHQSTIYLHIAENSSFQNNSINVYCCSCNNQKSTVAR